jgi:RHS repeat-associated protein
MQDVINSIESALSAYPDSLKNYRHYTEEHFLVSNVVPSLAMDRKVVVGDQEVVDSYDADELTITAVCPLSGELVLVSKFESIYHVPIGQVTVDIYEVNAGIAWFDGPKIDTKTAGDDGRVVFTGLKPGVRYRFDINGDASSANLNTLFSSYDQFIGDNHRWLNQQWGLYKPEWTGTPISLVGRTAGAVVTGIAKGVWGALTDIWDGIKFVYELLKDPSAIPDKAIEGLDEIRSEVARLISSAPKVAEKAMLFASDEAALFLLVNRTVLWMSMVPPDTAVETTLETITNFVVAITLDIVIGLALAVLSAEAAGALGIGYLAVRIGFYVKKFTGWVVRIANAVLDFFKELVEQVLKYADDVVDYRKVTVRGNRPALAMTNGNELHAEFDNQITTRVDQDNNTADASTQGTNGNNNAADSSDNTATSGCPVSLVTGEELLTLEDAKLPALIQFPFNRTYRTSSCEESTGLGFGWSHSLGHQLNFTAENVNWLDHEGRTTALPLPDKHAPKATNLLSDSAVYLGQQAHEFILISASVAPYYYHFSRQGDTGYLSAITDKYGNRLEIRYDGERRICRVESEQGNALGIAYHGMTRLISCISLQKKAEGRWLDTATLMSYQYNPQHQMISATNANGEAEHYQYDENNVLICRTLSGGAEFYWQWQGEGKAVKAVRHWANFDQMDIRYEWSDDGSVKVTNSDGSIEEYQHNENAHLVKQIDADGAQTEKVYGEKGELLEELDALGNKTEYHYDNQLQLLGLVRPDGSSTQFRYKRGKLVEKSEGKSHWQYEYNAQGDLILERDPLGNETRYSYDQNGLISRVSYPDNSSTAYQWNAQGQLITQESPDGRITKYRYDEFGRRIYEQAANGGITEYNWDAVGRLVSIKEPNRKARHYTYNAYGKVTSVTDENGQVTRYEYQEPLHLLTRKVNPDGSKLEYKYNNAKLFLSEIRNERGETCQLNYHPNGLISEELSFDGRQSRYAYDLNGHLTEKTEVGLKGTEVVTTYERDALGRLICKQLPDGEKVFYHYNEQGLLSEVDDGEWPLAYDYDLAGQLKAEHQGWGTLRYDYDVMGRLTHLRLPDDQLIDYDYKAGNISQINLNGQTLTRHYHQNGQEQYRQQGELTSQYQYDEQGRLKQHSVNQRERHAADPSRTVHHKLYQRSYSYTDNGNLASLEDSRKGKRHYHYDALSRLQQVTGSLEEQFVHDPAGNLLDPTGSQSRVSEGNRLDMRGDRHYAYDEFGNLTEEKRGKGQKLTTRYYYDIQHRLIKAEMPDGSQASYQYDAFGRRIAKSVTSKEDTQQTQFFWQGDKLIAEVDENSLQHTSYLYEPYTFKPLAMLQGTGDETKIYYYQLDHLGTPQELTNTQGKIVWSAQYRAYGQLALAEVEEVTNPLRFQGQYHDLETGLYYNRHRYYDPNSGRFTTIDPIALAGGLNNYQYVPNPTGWIDPLGLACVKGDCPDSASNESSYAGPVVPEYHLGNFTDGVAVNRQTTGNEVFYKYHGQDNRLGKTHNYVTNKKYMSEEALRNDLAILDEWDVEIDRVTTFQPPKGTWISEGTAAKQTGDFTDEYRPGGGYQGLIDIKLLPKSTVIRTDKLPEGFK